MQDSTHLVSNEYISKVRINYYHLLSHIESLIGYLKKHTDMQATVFQLPILTPDDVGQSNMHIPLTVRVGDPALDLALNHFTEHTLKDNQAGVTANRLPGVINVKTQQPMAVIERINRINTLKDEFSVLIRSYSKSEDEQFLLTKEAIPFAVRKAICRHIHAIQQQEIKSVRFSLSGRTSMSKTYKREYWIKKLEKSRQAKSGKINPDDWNDLIDIEVERLNRLPESTLLRIERPLKKAPIVNVRLLNGTKTTIIAHSPVLIFNGEGLIKPLADYEGRSTSGGNDKAPIIPRLHLYEVKKQP